MNTEAKQIARLEDYDEQEFNVLHPAILANPEATTPVIVQSVALRSLVAGEDTYNDFRFANQRDGKFALNGLALNKIATDAGVRWIEPVTVEARERRDDGHVYVRVRATGAVLQPNGEWYHITKHKEIDTADLADEYEGQFRKAAERKRQAVTEADVEAYVRDRLVQVKPHVLSLAETKCQFRVIRALLAIKQVYTKAELERPFVVPRLMYRPDAAMAIEQGRASASEIYGPPALPEVSSSDAHGEAAPDDSEAIQGTQSGAASAPGASDEGEEVPAEGEAGTSDSPEDVSPEPKDDPFLDDLLKAKTPHTGMRISEVAEHHPEFLRGIATGHRLKTARELAAQWLAYYQHDVPVQGELG